MKRLALLFLLAGAVAADCPGSDDSTGPDNDSIAGTWTLQSINSDPLPATVNDGEFTFTVTSGSVVINANGTFSFTETSDLDGVDNTTGTWVAASAANTYTFTPTPDPEETDQGTGTGVFSDNSMTLTISNSPGISRLYHRN